MIYIPKESMKTSMKDDDDLDDDEYDEDLEDEEGEYYPYEDVEEEDAEEAHPIEPVRTMPKIGRNEPCPCGSGKKYKKCHGK